MTNKIQIPGDGNQQLSALHRLYESERILNHEDLLIIMAHGFPGHKTGNNDLYGDLEFLLADKGYNCLRFDFRGCGESDGTQEQFSLSSAQDDFKSVLRWAEEKKYTRFVYIGEGLGGALAVMNVELNVQAMILLWPLLDMQDFYQKNFAELELVETAKKRGYIDHHGHKYGLGLLADLKNASLTGKLKDCYMPTLIMHGARDETIPVEHLDVAREHINARRLEITTFHDGEHGLQKLNHRKMMFHHVTQFIVKYT